MVDALAGKQVVILGLARQGRALAKFALEQGARVIVSDLRTAESLSGSVDEFTELGIEVVFGGHPMSLLENTDVLAVSGGVPLDIPIVQAALDEGIRVTNDSLEFMKRVDATVVGITGSAGKTTTTALTGHIIQQSGRRTWVGGNIGRPLIGELGNIGQDDVVVQELSSFQLELWDLSPDVAAILNVTPNHLDRHGSMAAYSAAKANILRYQDSDGVAVLCADDPGAMAMADQVHGRLRQFSLEKPVRDGAWLAEDTLWLKDGDRQMAVCHLEDIPLRGRHNVLNVLAAITLSDSVGVASETMAPAIATFSGVEHRLETVRTVGGVRFVNDSIATAPERAMAALDSYDEPIVLLAGGRDKEMVWDRWADRVHDRVRAVVLFGELADSLEMHLKAAAKRAGGGDPTLVKVQTLEEAVSAGHELALPGDIVLLAPGGTSFDAFSDFAARGEAFRDLVRSLPG